MMQVRYLVVDTGQRGDVTDQLIQQGRLQQVSLLSYTINQLTTQLDNQSVNCSARQSIS